MSFLSAATTAALAQSNPATATRPIRVIAPFPPGSAGDIIPRAIAPTASDALKQNMIVDNRPGAAGGIAAELVARAAPDGHTLLFGTTGVLAINPYLYAKLPYDPVKDFSPIGRTAVSQYAIVVAPSLPVKNLREYIAYARARPGELNVATSGTGTAVHLSGELFHSMTGIKTVHISYKGATEALTDLMAGRVQVMFASLSSAISFTRSGKIKMLAITGGQRHPSMPEVPTVREAAVPEYEVTGFFGYLAPAGTPAAVVKHLNETLNAVLNTQEIKDRLAGFGADVSTSTPEEFQQLIRIELAKWARAVKASGVKMQ
ncbi:MAG TPA: tripartite tricarboxylate transporter substrate binding protein [Burkholderiales bacterium]|nr:tripartite tricarboxylate transporter substrate binding protein [Burkholderiales bacterium]